MEGYCIWFKESAVNKLLSTGYQSKKVKEALKGDASITVAGAQVDVTWEVSKEPSVSFYDIDNLQEVLDENGEPLTIEANMFAVMAAVNLAVQGKKGSELPITLVSNPFLNPDQSVAFKMVGLLIDSSLEALDKAILRGICVNMLEAINKALGFSGEETPSVITLQFLRDLGLDFPDMGIKRDKGLLGVWARDGEGDLWTVIPDALDVGLVITDGAYSKVLTQQFRKAMCDGSVYGHRFTYENWLADVHGALEYSIRDVVCDSARDDIVELSVDPRIDFSADSKILPAAISYDCETDPNPIHAEGLAKVQGDAFSGVIDEFKSFKISLKCRGGGFSKIEEALLKGAIEYFANKIIDLMRSELKIPFNVPIPEKTIPTGIASLQVKLKDYETFTIDDIHNLYAGLEVSLEG